VHFLGFQLQLLLAMSASSKNASSNTTLAPAPNFSALEERGYRGFQKIDSGGQANVYCTYKVDGEEGSRAFAIKVVHLGEATPPSNMDEDLKRELAIVRNLKHRNCIRIEELLRTKSKIYIVMDYMNGGTIGQVVRKRGSLCEWNTKAWWSPVARAIKYLHEYRIAHRCARDHCLNDFNL